MAFGRRDRLSDEKLSELSDLLRQIDVGALDASGRRELALLLEKHRHAQLVKAAWDDVFVFARDVCGYSEVAEKPHRELCDFLMGRTPAQVERGGASKRQLILLPRGHFKSSVVTMAYSLWRLWHDPNMRILIDSELKANSMKFLEEMKAVAQTEAFVRVCGTWRADVGWREDTVRIAPCTATHKEGSLEAGGVDSPMVSRHYEMIIFDDPHSQRNINTAESLEKVRTHYKLLDAILEPQGEIKVVATRWHYADLSAMILGDEEIRNRYDVMVRSCYDEAGEPIFPSRFPHKELESKRRETGSYIFSCQYLNNPVPKEQQVFDPDSIPRWKVLPEAPLWYFTLVDPATAQKKRSDWTAVWVVGVSRAGDWYLVDGLRDRLDPGQRIKAVFDLAVKWRPQMIAWESVGFQQVDRFWFGRKMAEEGEYFSVSPTRQSRISKEDRIRRLIPRVQASALLVPHNGLRYKRLYDGHTEDLVGLLELEMVQFPVGRHDDLLDALSFLEEIDWIHVVRPGAPEREWAHEWSAEKMFEEERLRRVRELKGVSATARRRRGIPAAIGRRRFGRRRAA